MSFLRNSLALTGAALMSYSASEPCSAAMLTEIFAKPMQWLELTPLTVLKFSLPTVRPTGIQAADLSRLSNHDVVIMIDKSLSMAKLDCFPVCLDPHVDSSKFTDRHNLSLSRWQWCHEQTLDLTEKTKGSLPIGMTVVLFSSNSEVYSNVDAKAVEKIFSDNTPKGGTNIMGALENQLTQYFERRNGLGPHTKPLLIAIITDGCPDNPSRLREVIIDATKKMITPAEISISFLQVGNDTGGSKVLTELDNGLIDQKAKFDIVDVTPFTEMSKIGLAQALVNEVRKTQYLTNASN